MEDTDITKFAGHLFDLMAEKYGHGVTITQLRVMNRLYACHDNDVGCSVSDIALSLSISAPTASKAVTKLISHGWLTDVAHDDDGRRRVISLSRYALSRRASDYDGLHNSLKK